PPSERGGCASTYLSRRRQLVAVAQPGRDPAEWRAAKGATGQRWRDGEPPKSATGGLAGPVVATRWMSRMEPKGGLVDHGRGFRRKEVAVAADLGEAHAEVLGGVFGGERVDARPQIQAVALRGLPTGKRLDVLHA